MTSPYFKVLERYNILKNKEFTCTPQLSIDNFRSTQLTGRSASGMVFGIGEVEHIPVFVKMFAMKSNIKSFSTRDGKIIHRKNVQLDPNCLELGNTKYMSDLLFSKIPFTQNLTAVYGIKSCKYAFETDISFCTKQPIPYQEEYLIPNNRPELPQSNFISNYKFQNWDDQVNVLIVEHCDGDLENLFNSTTKNYLDLEMNADEFNKIWNSIFLQLSLTLISMNLIMGYFNQNDMGFRNILFTVSKSNHTYFQYNIGHNIYFVENVGYIPKVWDLPYMFLNEEIISMLKTSGNYNYLREEDVFESSIPEPIPSMIQLCRQVIEMESFVHVKNLDVCKKIIKIAQLEEDNFDYYIEQFETFIPTQEYILLEPIFQLDLNEILK